MLSKPNFDKANILEVLAANYSVVRLLGVVVVGSMIGYIVVMFSAMYGSPAGGSFSIGAIRAVWFSKFILSALIWAFADVVRDVSEIVSEEQSTFSFQAQN